MEKETVKQQNAIITQTIYKVAACCSDLIYSLGSLMDTSPY